MEIILPKEGLDTPEGRAKAADRRRKARHMARRLGLRGPEIHKRPRVFETDLERQQFRLKTDPAFRIRRNLRKRIWYALNRCGGKKAHSILDLMGCTSAFIRQYLESQFQPGMNWSNYGVGKGKWHVDHRVPLASVGNAILKLEVLKLLSHWSNLQPMWGAENISKGMKLTQDCQLPLLLE